MKKGKGDVPKIGRGKDERKALPQERKEKRENGSATGLKKRRRREG